MRTTRTAWVLAAAAALTGCGGGRERTDEPRPPTPIDITAAITRDGLTVSPTRFGAGPVVILIANETARARRVTVETDELAASSPGLRQRTEPIGPGTTAALKLEMPRGRYTVTVDGEQRRPVALRVRRARPSSSDELLTP